MKENEFFFVEVKSEKGVLSKLQEYRIAEMAVYGIKTIIKKAKNESKN